MLWDYLDKVIRILKHRNSWHAEGVFPYKIMKGLGIVVDGKHYMTKVKITIEDVLSKSEIEKLPKDILKKIKLALEDYAYSEEEVKSLIRWVVECYLASIQS